MKREYLRRSDVNCCANCHCVIRKNEKQICTFDKKPIIEQGYCTGYRRQK